MAWSKKSQGRSPQFVEVRNKMGAREYDENLPIILNGSLAAFLNPSLTAPERTTTQVKGWILGVA